jgi:hypothetical protein
MVLKGPALMTVNVWSLPILAAEGFLKESPYAQKDKNCGFRLKNF